MNFSSAAPANGSVDSPEMRHAGRELLSLALMDARNHTLGLMAHYEQALAANDWVVPLRPELNPPLWELGHIGWFQERWIARNPQRHMGMHCDPLTPLSASRLVHADRWWDSSQVAHASRWGLDMPDFEAIKSYLLATLEESVDLLHASPPRPNSSRIASTMSSACRSVLAKTRVLGTSVRPGKISSGSLSRKVRTMVRI